MMYLDERPPNKREAGWYRGLQFPSLMWAGFFILRTDLKIIFVSMIVRRSRTIIDTKKPFSFRCDEA